MQEKKDAFADGLPSVKSSHAEQLLDGANLIRRVGASVLETGDSDQDSLPLVVFLKGDEVYFADFNLDSDQVMDILSIKRSRLNQISGRELRVARKRDGRYIRPFYREKDVTAYLEWTRATVTHKRSSELVDHAARELADRADSISEDFKSIKLSIIDALENKFEQRFKQIMSIQTQQFETFAIALRKAESSRRVSQQEIDVKTSEMCGLQIKLAHQQGLVGQSQENILQAISRLLTMGQIETHLLDEVISSIKQIRQDLRDCSFSNSNFSSNSNSNRVIKQNGRNQRLLRQTSMRQYSTSKIFRLVVSYRARLSRGVQTPFHLLKPTVR